MMEKKYKAKLAMTPREGNVLMTQIRAEKKKYQTKN